MAKKLEAVRASVPQDFGWIALIRSRLPLREDNSDSSGIKEDNTT